MFVNSEKLTSFWKKSENDPRTLFGRAIFQLAKRKRKPQRNCFCKSKSCNLHSAKIPISPNDIQILPLKKKENLIGSGNSFFCFDMNECTRKISALMNWLIIGFWMLTKIVLLISDNGLWMLWWNVDDGTTLKIGFWNDANDFLNFSRKKCFSFWKTYAKI